MSREDWYNKEQLDKARKAIQRHPDVVEALTEFHGPQHQHVDGCSAHWEGLMCCVDYLLEEVE